MLPLSTSGTPSGLHMNSTRAVSQHQRHPQWLAHGLHAGGLVHRRADDGEVEAFPDADVAVHHLVQVHRDACRQAVRAGWRRRREGLEAGLGGLYRPSRGRRLVSGDGEDGENRVADERENLAPLRGRPGHGLEGGIEHRHHLLHRQAVGERGEAAQVAQPDGRVDALAGAALEVARQHPPRGVGPQVHLEQG
jgi:hypothetical protein